MPPLLEVENVTVEIPARHGLVRAVDRVSFHVLPGERLGIVGESGSGKTMTATALMRLLLPPARMTEGSIRFEGRDVLAFSSAELARWRGSEISMVFQDPLTSLNPFLRVGIQVAEVLEIHRGLGRRAALREVAVLLERVGIPDARRRLHDYPHQFSGGMRQRVALAIAIACRPKLMLADEPTTALDVTVQAHILDLLRELSDEARMAVVLITHDLGVVADFCDRVNIMYAGRVVESGSVDEIAHRPKHPYTRALLGSIPALDASREEALRSIPGAPPDLTRRFVGCPFAARCPDAMDVCRATPPPIVRTESGWAACHAVVKEVPA